MQQQSLRPAKTPVGVPTLKVVIIGEPSVGKTTLLESYSGKNITLTSRQPTIGADFVKRKATLADGQTEVSL